MKKDSLTFSERLLAWYHDEKRLLPWRDQPDPYGVWISEIMLQQTQVQTVLPYYERWMRQFPTVDALASAPLDDVLRVWAGLGYYSRARNVHRAAVEVVDNHGGRLPTNFDALRRLPGIGTYTAGAIASICFEERRAAVDGNVLRVFARLFSTDTTLSRSHRERLARDWVEGLLPLRLPGDFNQALMELGATICVPRKPLCARCPVAESCQFPALPEPSVIPRHSVKRTPRHRVVAVGAALTDASGRLLLMRRQESGLLGGLWELPSEQLVRIEGATRARNGKSGDDWLDSDVLQTLGPFIEQALGLKCTLGAPLSPVHHTFSHIDYTLIVCAGRCDDLGVVRVPEERYSRAILVARDELEGLGLSTLAQRALSAVFENDH